MLNYEYRGNEFVFTTDDYKTSNSMVLKGDLIKRGKGFAIESYPGEPKANCKQQSDDLLLPWMVNCTGNIVLRRLTQKETVQIIEYQLDHISKWLFGLKALI